MKKLLAAFVTCTLTAAMLAGCGAADNDKGASDNNTNTSTDESKDTTSDGDTTADTQGDQTASDENTNSQDQDTSVTDFTTVNEGVLTMATNAYFPPYEYYEGEDIIGIDVEIAGEIAKKLGLELKIEDMEFDSIIMAVQQGKADMGLAGMTVTDERLESVNFTDSYATGIQSVIVVEDSEIATIEDLQEKKIGVQLMTTGDFLAQEKIGEEFVEEYNKGADAVMALTQGKVDAVIIDNQPALSYVSSTQGLKILDTQFAIEDYAAAISKDNTGLLTAVNGALEELKADGTLQGIVDKYIVTE